MYARFVIYQHDGFTRLPSAFESMMGWSLLLAVIMGALRGNADCCKNHNVVLLLHFAGRFPPVTLMEPQVPHIVLENKIDAYSARKRICICGAV